MPRFFTPAFYLLLPAAVAGLVASRASAQVSFATEVQPRLQQFCYDCHNNQKAKSDINFEKMGDEQAYRDVPDLLDALAWVVSEQEMPPKKHPAQPSRADRDLLVAWAEKLLAEAQGADPNQPGRVVVPRLNHIEYNQVIRDITGFDIDVADIFPRDGGGGEGFANVGEAQSATPMQVEKFLSAAKEVVAHAHVSESGLLTWSPEPVSVLNGPVERLETLKEQWTKLHDDFYNRLLGELSEIEAGHEYRFTPYIEAAWRYKHRAALGQPNASVGDIAAGQGLDIPEIVLEKWVQLMAQPQNSRYLDLVIRRFNSLPAPGTDGMTGERISLECARMAKYLELYGRQDIVDQWLPEIETPADWLSMTDENQRKKARKAHEDELNRGVYQFRIDLTKVASPPEFLYFITSPAGDGAEDDIVLWSKGEWDNGSRKVSWRYHDAVKLFSANGQPVMWGDHPAYKQTPYDGYAVRAPAVFKAKVPPGVKYFTVEAQVDPVHGKNASVQVMVDTQPPERIIELAGRYILGPGGSENRNQLLAATGDVRKAVFDDAIESNRAFVFHDYPGLDPERLAATEGAQPAANAARPFALSVSELRTQIAPEEKRTLERLASEMSRMLTPTETESTLSGAKTILADLALKAWRRPPSSEEIDRLMALYDAQRKLGLPYERAVKQTMVGVFVDPNFLYRIQASRNSQEPYPLNDFELASRLSFALWGSIPDDELIQLASNGRLRQDPVLRGQIRRMLQDERAATLSDNFAGHWLHFVGFNEYGEVDVERFETFTPGLRQAMADEVGLFFTNLIREDGSVKDILFANYSYMNETLAKHYGITGVTGDHMRRVSFGPESRRKGVITMGAILTKTSKSLRTSPVSRGDFIVEKVLGIEMPAPPDEVPMLSDDETNAQGLSLLEQLKQHRASPQCSGCHQRIDPVGLAMENFDPIGRWRDTMLSGAPVVNHGTLASGQTLNGFGGLMGYLEDKQDLFLDQLCRKFLGYALGRKIHITDQPLIDEMKQALADNNYRFSAMAETALTSQQFLYRQDFGADLTSASL